MTHFDILVVLMLLVSLLDESVAILFLTFLGDVEDVTEQVDTVVVELEVERSLLLGFQISFSCLVSTPRIREEIQVVRVLVAVSKRPNGYFGHRVVDLRRGLVKLLFGLCWT